MNHPMQELHARIRRRLLLQAAGALTMPLLGTGMAAAQDAFPSRPMRLVVPFPAGGPTDIVARPLAQLLGEALGQQVIVDNRGGAGGSIAADMVAKAPPDGYTLLMGTVGTQAINASLYKKLPYDPLKDFVPLGLTASAPVALVVNASTPYKTMQELISAARREPGTIAFGSAGNGTPGHLTGELFANSAGVRLNHIPYKGSAPAVTDLVGGQIPVMFDPVQSVQSHIKSGRLRALAVSSKNRSPVLPDVPTMSEAGLRDFDAEAWWGVFAPARLPAREAELLRREIEKVVRSDAFREKLGNLGVTPSAPLAVSFDAFNRAELAKWGKAVRDSGAALD